MGRQASMYGTYQRPQQGEKRVCPETSALSHEILQTALRDTLERSGGRKGRRGVAPAPAIPTHNMPYQKRIPRGYVKVDWGGETQAARGQTGSDLPSVNLSPTRPLGKERLIARAGCDAHKRLNENEAKNINRQNHTKLNHL